MPPAMHSFLRKLKRDFPSKKPVRVRTFKSLKGPDNERLYGCLHDKGDYFEIWVARGPDVSLMVDTLFHEYTHAIVWPSCKWRHGIRFWKTYGSIYRHYLD